MKQSYLFYLLQFAKSLLLLSFIFSFTRFYGYPTGDGGQLSLLGSFGFAVFGMITTTMLYAAPALIAPFAYRYFYNKRLIAAVISFALFALYHYFFLSHISPEFESLSAQYPSFFWVLFLAIIALTELFIWRKEKKQNEVK
ncbi:MAG: hypothetical protein Q4G44_00870 [Alcaligenaceae bacterium]|nr:hypothetical protein [Alcaligenaceae bacterium]